MAHKEIFKLIEQLEETVIAHRPRKSLLPPIKGKSYAEGRIGSLELKKCIDKLSIDDESKFLIEGLVFGCLILGKDAGENLTASQDREIYKPYVDKYNAQVLNGKLQEHKLKKQCLKIAKDTWEFFPKASKASLAEKLCNHFYELENNVNKPKAKENLNQSTVEKDWLYKCDFKPEVRSLRALEYNLIIKI